MVPDRAIEQAILLLLEHTHNLAEGAGAIPLAAALQLKERLAGKKVVLVMSGGNLALERAAADPSSRSRTVLLLIACVVPTECHERMRHRILKLCADRLCASCATGRNCEAASILPRQFLTAQPPRVNISLKYRVCICSNDLPRIICAPRLDSRVWMRFPTTSSSRSVEHLPRTASREIIHWRTLWERIARGGSV